jgi:hypothetical protein
MRFGPSLHQDMKGLDKSFSKVVIRGGWPQDPFAGCLRHRVLIVVAGFRLEAAGLPFQAGDRRHCLVVEEPHLAIPEGVTGG